MESYLPKQDLLKNRVILITGASRGIGRVVAKAYAAHGATVILLARSIKKLESLYDEIESAGHPKPAIYPFNLATAGPDEYTELAANIETHFSTLSGLLHNAAMLGSLTPIEHYPIKQWYDVMQVNLNSSFLLTKALLPLLKSSPHASVIFTTADIGKKSKAYWGAYAISKLACDTLMQILSAELETHTQIRVNSINPGKVRTALRASAYPTEDQATLLKQEQLIPHYLYLMGEDSVGIRGMQYEVVKPTFETALLEANS